MRDRSKLPPSVCPCAVLLKEPEVFLNDVAPTRCQRRDPQLLDQKYNHSLNRDATCRYVRIRDIWSFGFQCWS